MTSCDPITLSSDTVTAHILPEFGFNLFHLAVVADGTPVSVLWYDDAILSGNARPSGSGIPILFPFAGRLHGTSLEWKGKTYELDEGDGMGNAIHGFVLDRPWRVLEQHSDSIVGEFQCSKDAPELLDKWPSDFKIRTSYQLTANGIDATYTCTNAGHETMPCGLGTHAYFQVPLSGADADLCRLQLPITTRWEMRDMIATGNRVPLSAHEDFKNGMPFGDLVLDDVFGDPVFENGTATAKLLESNTTLQLSWDSVCPYCVVYTPPHREAICVEPYTLIPGGHSFKAPYEGLQILEPGDAFTHQMSISLTTE